MLLETQPGINRKVDPSFVTMRAVIKDILQNPFEDNLRGWTLQGFGMLRLYLDSEGINRLHVWAPDYQVGDVSTIHDHPWDFTSTIYSGTMMNTRFVKMDGAGTESYQVATIKCGVGGGMVGEPQPETLYMMPDETYGVGQSYHQFAPELHESTPSKGCVSVIVREFHEDTEHATVAWQQGDWVTAEPRPATSVEVRTITQAALERWT